MLIGLALPAEARIEASQAIKGLAYICPGCRESIILAKGRIRRAYFSHRPNSTCNFATLETWEHQQAKEDFAASYRARDAVCELEAEVLTIEGDRRADVLIHAPGGDHRIALEVQHSALDYAALEMRTGAYVSAEVAAIWVPILNRKRVGEPQRIAGTNIYHVSHYATPAWHGWIDDLQGGLWFYDPVVRGIWRAKLDNCMLYRNPTSWFADGDEQSAGGHWYASDRWDVLFLQGPYALGDLRIRRSRRVQRKRRAYVLPAGIGADFMLNGEPADFQLPVRIGSAEVEGGGFRYHRVEYSIDGQWVAPALQSGPLPHSLLV